MTTKQIIIAVATIIVAVALAMVYVRNNEADTRTLLEAQLNNQEMVLREVAETVYLNKEDATINAYVRDCTTAARAEFDSHLDRLANLTPAELERTELLFEACARYFAEQKSAGVARLREAYRQYHNLIDVYSIIDSHTHKRLQTEDWELFIGFEEQLAELLHSQVPIQKDIITLLQDGVPASDPAIRAKINEAQEINQSATVISRQTDSVYARLTN